MCVKVIVSRVIESLCLLEALSSGTGRPPHLPSVTLRPTGEWAGLLRIADPQQGSVGIDPRTMAAEDIREAVGLDPDLALRQWSDIGRQASAYLDDCARRAEKEQTTAVEETADLVSWLRHTVPIGADNVILYPCVSVWPKAFGVLVGRTLNVIYPLADDRRLARGAICHEWAHVWLREAGATARGAFLAERIALTIGRVLETEFRRDQGRGPMGPGEEKSHPSSTAEQ